MKDKLQNELYNNYQSLFRDVGKSPIQSCMAFGIECGDGWYDILSSLCFLINQHERNIEGQTQYKQKENPDYVSNYHPVIFQQIKQKFGGLRVYFGGGDDYVDGLVDMAERWSYRTCEICGEKGKPNKQGWITTLCEECWKDDVMAQVSEEMTKFEEEREKNNNR